MDMKTVEITILMDAGGDFGVGRDRDSAVEDYENNVQSIDNSLDGLRLYDVKLTLPAPDTVTLETTAPTLPPDGGTVTLSLSPEPPPAA